MSLTDQIIAKLKTLGLEAVYYGCIPSQLRLNKYNYAVVMKAKPEVTASTWVDRYRIAIVMEEKIPDDYIKNTVLPKLKEIPRLKFEPASIQDPDYAIPANTATKLEAQVFYMSMSKAWCG